MARFNGAVRRLSLHSGQSRINPEAARHATQIPVAVDQTIDGPLHHKTRPAFPVIVHDSSETTMASVVVIVARIIQSYNSRCVVTAAEHEGKSIPSIFISNCPSLRQGTKLRYKDIT
ncbi:hypothetical protein BLNAU_11363 [Blattamonas nauphoetae]|uniref:Uncharacterized protein n=1 Tax=Blattamonas nauphoetae TaxID=2049346 RepID=A0ABQ9XQH0_9EUKA|nr:hypothetical protein BLNAU_11363 [Blattamonas nauphoetae]